MSRPYYKEVKHFGKTGSWGLKERLDDVLELVDFRPSDSVLDVGCAEGLISMEVAARVARVHGIEPEPQRIAAARTLAKKRRVMNVTFEQGSVLEQRFPAGLYDIVLFLGVYHHLPEDRRDEALIRVLRCAKRLAVIRTSLYGSKMERAAAEARGQRPVRILEAGFRSICEAQGFEMRVHDRGGRRVGDLIIATRR
jgi:2-polyprenyl-3-methyl-5-hydroxy-6-metoxy-1,4-benzoquinol methylase